MAKKRKKQHKKKIEEKDGYTVEISHMRNNIKTFIEKFRADIDKKRKAYQKLQKKR